jgi:hypothetical protein
LFDFCNYPHCNPIWRAVRNIAAKHDKSYPPVRKPDAARGADGARHEDFIGHPANEGLELNKLSAIYSINTKGAWKRPGRLFRLSCFASNAPF